MTDPDTAQMTCRDCGRTRTLQDFPSRKGMRTGLSNYCRDCTAAKARDTYYRNHDVNKEKQRIKSAKFRHDDPIGAALYQARRRAKERGLPFDLTRDDIQVPAKCPALGIPMGHQFGLGRFAKGDHSPSIDRIDNTKGYTRGNVIVVSLRANRLKNNATIAELQALAAFYSSLPAMQSAIPEGFRQDEKKQRSPSWLIRLRRVMLGLSGGGFDAGDKT